MLRWRFEQFRRGRQSREKKRRAMIKLLCRDILRHKQKSEIKSELRRKGTKRQEKDTERKNRNTNPFPTSHQTYHKSGAVGVYGSPQDLLLNLSTFTFLPLLQLQFLSTSDTSPYIVNVVNYSLEMRSRIIGTSDEDVVLGTRC